MTIEIAVPDDWTPGQVLAIRQLRQHAVTTAQPVVAFVRKDITPDQLKEIHERSIRELEGILSDDLRRELTEVTLPFTSEAPSDAELRIAQAQLVGWLEGLFHGIQATLFTQQMQAQQQFEEMRQRRALEPGPGGRPPGNYL